jgi:hypothetical protein|tara:strand:+ start:164 stop:910 length:747 start_codon:yes stop_codon:yes gene_type:complete
MKKKEIIFYESNSFPSPGPEILELKADNKGSIIEEGVMQGIESELTETKIKNFWKKMDELNVWNWDKNYSFGRICDGHMWKLHLRNKEGKVKVSNGHQEYPYNFKKVINALNNLFGSKVEKGQSFDTEKEIIEFSSEYYGGGMYILLKDNIGSVDESGKGDFLNVKIDEFKKQNFWKNIEKLDVWKWYNKYPHRKPKYEPLTCQAYWNLKIIYQDKAKYCSGYAVYPKNFKKFTKELSDLMGVELNIE